MSHSLTPEIKVVEKKGQSFTEQLDQESLKFFSEVAKRTFSEQAQFFLNAFWDEFGDQAECIYCVAWEVMKMADMRWRNVQYVHLYEEGNDLDFDMALYFFEQLCKFFDQPENKRWKTDFPKSVPVMQTAVVRKQELKSKVDVNFDGRVSFLEYLLYQYGASPKTLMDRSQGGNTNEALEAAKRALAEVNEKIRAYETERARLEALAAPPNSGVKALKAKNELAQLDSSPLAEELRKLLITAEAAVRLAGRGLGNHTQGSGPRSDGAVWWLTREVTTKKAKYGKKPATH